MSRNIIDHPRTGLNPWWDASLQINFSVFQNARHYHWHLINTTILCSFESYFCLHYYFYDAQHFSLSTTICLYLTCDTTAVSRLNSAAFNEDIQYIGTSFAKYANECSISCSVFTTCDNTERCIVNLYWQLCFELCSINRAKQSEERQCSVYANSFLCICKQAYQVSIRLNKLFLVSLRPFRDDTHRDDSTLLGVSGFHTVHLIVLKEL